MKQNLFSAEQLQEAMKKMMESFHPDNFQCSNCDSNSFQIKKNLEVRCRTCGNICIKHKKVYDAFVSEHEIKDSLS